MDGEHEKVNKIFYRISVVVIITGGILLRFSNTNAEYVIVASLIVLGIIGLVYFKNR